MLIAASMVESFSRSERESRPEPIGNGLFDWLSLIGALLLLLLLVFENYRSASSFVINTALRCYRNLYTSES